MSTYRVGYFVGSLATASINRTLSKALIRLAPTELEFEELPIKDLPLYSYDYDYPAVARKLKEQIASSDGILSVTPEYNRAIPGGLKNAIDWASPPGARFLSSGSPRRSLVLHLARWVRPWHSRTCGASSASATRRR